VISHDNLFLNRILAAITLVVSFIVYLSTMSPTVPYWDCGEFIATSYILGVPHPPGSPLYLILGRIFSMLPLNTDIAYRVNLMSPITSAVAVMLLYLIIVKVIAHFRGEIRTRQDAIIAFGAAFVGTMTFAFTDSHWFNAVEAEVYAISTFFTAIVVWLILHWSDRADEQGSERYILIIAYMFGLAIGVHILNLLTLPFIALIIYFRKMEFEWKTFFITTAITFFTFLIIHNGIIKGLPHLAGSTLGLPGVIVLVLLVVGVTIWSILKKHQLLSLALTSMVLILVGYSSYALIFIRSGQDPAIDENNPENIPAAISYLEREQYGEIGQFPRRYKGLSAKHEIVGRPAAGRNKYSSSQNRKYMFYNGSKQWDFFWNYQIRKMYNRYFLWQFAGRGPSSGDYTTAMGANFREDGVYWLQFGLPLGLILGLIGMVHHFRKDWNIGFTVFTLFFVIGWLLILYLNQDNPQPRERDYSYVGSFMAFAIWIGVGSAAIGEWITQYIKKPALSRNAIITALVLQVIFIPGVMLKANYSQHDRSGNFVAWDYSYNLLQSCEPNGILFTNGDNDTFPLWYLQEVEGIRKDVTVANLSLLNTPWYIKQLRDLRPTDAEYNKLIEEREGIENIGRRFIKVDDDDIRNITAGLTRWKTREVTFPVKSENQITWTVKPTFAKQALKVQDMMIMQIINDANWKSPIYFAVTVSPGNRIGLEEYLEMEGLAYRLRPYKTRGVNADRMELHLMTDLGSDTWQKGLVGKEWEDQEGTMWFRSPHEKYLFRNLGNEDVHYNSQVIRLLQNYRSAYMQLAVHHFMEFQKSQASDNEESTAIKKAKVEEVLDEMSENLPEHTIHMDNRDLHYQVGRLYYGVGNKEKFSSVLDELMERNDNTVRHRVEYAQSYMELEDFDTSLTILENLYNGYNSMEAKILAGGRDRKNVDTKVWNQYRKNYPDIVSHLIINYRKLDMEDEAMDLLTSWLERNPKDKEAQKLLKEMESGAG
jgi:chaperonin cofactor prefoldin